MQYPKTPCLCRVFASLLPWHPAAPPPWERLFIFIVLLSSCLSLLSAGWRHQQLLMPQSPSICNKQRSQSAFLASALLLTFSLIFSEKILLQNSQGRNLENKIFHLAISTYNIAFIKVTEDQVKFVS